jgi:hypothetical protein
MDNVRNASVEAELKNCADDFVYFCENHIKIVHPTRGLIPFTLFEYQKRYIKALEENRFVACVKFRQGGFTSLTLAWFTWRFLFKLDESNMVFSKTDKEAIYCNHIVRQMISHLPDHLMPMYSKCNDHQLHNGHTNSKIFFYNPEPARGRAINYLLIDEPAFIKDMDFHWKAMYPCLSTGGHCIALSTTNGNKGWFYDVVTRARAGENDFHVFDVHYTEHPDYNNPEWVDQMKKNLGENGFRQEVLCEFLGHDPDPQDDPPQHERPDQNFWCDVSLKEEAKIIHECRKRAYERGHRGGQLGNIVDNKQPEHLTWENLEDQPITTIDFDIKRPHKFTSYYYSDLAEEMAEEYFALYESDSQIKLIEEKKQNLKELEDRVNADYVGNELLVLAGVLDESQKYDPETDLPPFDGDSASDKILNKIKEIGSFPENLKISFSNKKFCVGDVPTNIDEFDLCCLHHGLAAFTSNDKATEKIAKLVCKRMTPLFGIKKEK